MEAQAITGDEQRVRGERTDDEQRVRSERAGEEQRVRSERAAPAGAGAASDRAERIHHPGVESLDLARIMHTLGDPVRLEIVRALADGKPRLCGEIAELVGLPISTSSYHIRLLREAGITRTRADGTKRLISLRRDDLDRRFPGLADVITR